ncbi:hypothetical protein [Rickettsia endosymbiont of Ixodes pacificus]|nr:hypothetical protein [Rickettsia endosymbiont of Ixodes pacificus]
MSSQRKRGIQLNVIPRLDRGILGHSLLYKIPWSSHGMTIRIKK